MIRVEKPLFFLVTSETTSAQQNHVFFASTIVSIPDLSSYEEFQNVDLLEQLRRVINAQRLLLMGLNSQVDLEKGYRSFELRYIWNKQKLTLAILGKGSSPSRQYAHQLSEGLWNDLIKLFPFNYYRGGLQPIVDKQSFQEIYQPFPIQFAQVVALHKHVDRYMLLKTKQEYPIVYPYKWGISSMAGLCKTLLQQENPHFISLALFPEERNENEIQGLNQLAAVLKKAGEGRERSSRMGMVSTMAAVGNQVSSRDTFGNLRQEAFIPDPQAKICAEILEEIIQRYGTPLIFRPYIVAEGSVSPSVIGALQLEMIGHTPNSSDPSKLPPLPRLPKDYLLEGPDLTTAQSDLLFMEANTLEKISLPFAKIQGEYKNIAQKLNRLPFLVNVDEAVCAFRLPALPQRDEVGLKIHSGAFISFDQKALDEQSIPIGNKDDQNSFSIHVDDFTKHVLVAGTTGSGKTTTCLHLLTELARKGIPFLVIEPVNSEHNDYRSLIRLPGLDQTLQIFTLGDEETSPFRINPFEIQPGVTVNEHISSLLTAFKAAIPMWEPLPRIFLKALNRMYFHFGWPPFSKPAGTVTDLPFPTLRDFYREISQVVDEEIEHEGEVKGNIRGATKLRVEALLEGSCGRILSAQRTLPIEIWMEHPTVMELRHVGDDEDKALLIAFLLIAVNEYLGNRRNTLSFSVLKHVTLIEEAHRLLENIQNDPNPEKSNTKGQAAQAFAHALAESRKYGEGIIIAEQLPTKLVPDAIGNTGLKIMHRLTSANDRESLGKAMNLNSFQQENVAMLHTGQAAVYGVNLEEPLLIQSPDFWSDWEQKGFPVKSRPMSDNEVAEKMQWIHRQFARHYVPFDGCQLCRSICHLRDIAEGLLNDKALRLTNKFIALFMERSGEETAEMVLRKIIGFCHNSIECLPKTFEVDDQNQIAYCLFLHLKNYSNLFPIDSEIVEKQFYALQEAE